jgi:chromosome segregation ATPase
VTLSTASRTEVEYGIKLRDNEKKQLELAKIRAENAKYLDFLKKQGEELTYVKRLRHDLQHKLEESDKTLEHVRFKNQEYEKKIEKLEKRIELILETDIGSDKDHMRKAITELVKENEKFKRQGFVQEKELKKNRDEMNKVRGKVQRQNKKIENLLKKKGAPAATDDLEKNLFNKNPTDDPHLSILQANTLPVTLDFRHSSLKVQYAGTSSFYF